MVNVIARSRLKSGCLEEYLRILKANVPTVLAEEGCLRYEPCLDLEADPARGEYVTILESWESPAHLQAHLATKHMAAFREAVAPLREENSVLVVTPA